MKWIELFLLNVLAFCGCTGLAILLTMAGLWFIAVVVVICMFAFANWAWLYIYKPSITGRTPDGPKLS